MFVAIDIGNTHTVVGVYKNNSLLASMRLSSKSRKSKDEIGAHVRSLLAEAEIRIQEVEGVGISSVVPKLTDIYSAMVQKCFRQNPLIINTELDIGIRIRYENPITLGADRICNAIAGYAKYGGPLIIIDFGTATTYDVVASNGDYLGGVIAAGIKTSAAALHKRTAKLPKIELVIPPAVIGFDTVSSMQTGILWGAIDALTGMVNRIQKELHKIEPKKAKVIATGGFSEFIAKRTRVIEHVEPSLVLDGIRLIYERVKSNG